MEPRVVYVRVNDGSATAQWIICPPQAAELAITNVPASVTDAAVIVEANVTLLLLPFRASGRPPFEVAFERLGKGKQVNLYRGRPPLPEGQRRDERLEVRLEPSIRAKVDRCGGASWVRELIRTAREKKS